MDLFLRLMANRKSNPISKEWTDALNQIDVIFQDNKSVRSAWRAYFDSLHPRSQHYDNANSFHLDLLSEIANDLGYKDLKQTELDRFYSPVQFGDSFDEKNSLNKEMIRVLQNSENLGSARKKVDDKV